MIGMMMAINAVEHLNTHAEKSRCFPFVDAGLHEPRRRGVPQRVRSYPALESCQLNRAVECRLYRFDGFSAPLHKVRTRDAFLPPSTQMCEKSRRDRNRRLPLVGFAVSFRQAIINAAFEIHIRMIGALVRRG